MTIIMDGKKLAGEITDDLKNKVMDLKERGFVPKLVILQVGENPASDVYLKMKQKKAVEIGAICEVIKFKDDAPESDIAKTINELNDDETVHGVLLQLPLPSGYDEKSLINQISPRKDVDGLTDANQIKILNNENDGIVPATPRGIMALLNKYDLVARKVVVVGRSRLVGKTIALMLLNRNATVTICHSKTIDLQAETSRADVLIVAAGSPGLIEKDFVKSGACVIDVGMNRTDDGLRGDVDFEEVKEVAGYITPVPGGVGPMTVVSLFDNLVDACVKVYQLK